MTKLESLADNIKKELSDYITTVSVANQEVTVETQPSALMGLLTGLKSSNHFLFDQLIDLCGVDYLLYGQYDWQTESATESGFSRGVERQASLGCAQKQSRYAVVYHLLSTSLNQRVRVKAFVDEQVPILPSVHTLWKGADWFEREAYDLYGILFENHPDLRRILTDYGFIGHPFRKDFPVSGHVEMRYDASLQKVIYEPVDIEPRILVPKVIRHDNRYNSKQQGAAQ